MKKLSLTRFAYLSILAAFVTIALKSLAYFLTGSIGLLSDAMESVVNLIAALIALFALRLAQKPPDANHEYGHSKAEYFSSIVEGVLIFLASLLIVYTSVGRILHPQAIDQTGLGLVVSAVASLVNLIIGMKLLEAGKKYHSIALVADARHLFTDVWTSVGVIVGVAVVSVTHIYILDPIFALLIAVNIVFTGYKLVKQSMLGFMDTVIPEEDQKKVKKILDGFMKDSMEYHALRTRQSGSHKFISVHILVPGNYTIQKGHDLLEEIEKKISRELYNTTVFTHIEPIEDPKSQDDISIDRV